MITALVPVKTAFTSFPADPWNKYSLQINPNLIYDLSVQFMFWRSMLIRRSAFLQMLFQNI
jgi:hypothetical protein